MQHWRSTIVMLLVALSACSLAPSAATGEARVPTGAVPTGTASPLSAPADATAVILPTEAPPIHIPGIISFYREATDDVVQAPAEVATNTPFDVTIATFGDGCTTRGDAGVVVSGNVAIITVTDLQRQPAACPQPLVRFPRTVTLQFATPGEGVIRVDGQRVGPETDRFPHGTPTTLERRVRVH